jgi:hypothetical protein
VDAQAKIEDLEWSVHYLSHLKHEAAAVEPPKRLKTRPIQLQLRPVLSACGQLQALQIRSVSVSEDESRAILLTFRFAASLDDQDLVKNGFQRRISARVNLDELTSANVQGARVERDILHDFKCLFHKFDSFLKKRSMPCKLLAEIITKS